MRFPALLTLLATLVAASSSCTGRDVSAPSPGPRTMVAQRVVGESLPTTHYCTPASSTTEQWVGFSQMTLVIDRGSGFELTATDAQGNAQYTIDGSGTKTYIAQMSVGGARGVAGTLLPEQNGVRELRMERATTIYGEPTDFAGRFYGDSAVVTDKVHCLTPVGTDSAHVFTVVLK